MKDQVLSCIKSRRSIRRFKQEQIEDSQLNVLLEAAIWAPSGSNSQSWLFTAIYNKDTLKNLNETVRKAFLTWTPDDDYPAKRRATVNAQKEGFNFFHNAPTLIIASNMQGYQNAMADCVAAQQNIFLAAHAMGLGACWINQLRWLTDDVGVRGFLEEIGLPKNHVICCSAAVGYPDHTPPAPARKEGTTLIVR